MIEKIGTGFAKWSNNALSYLISWLGLRLFYERYCVTDNNGKVQALLFTNDARHVMLLKDGVGPIIELVDHFKSQLEQLEEILIQKGVVIEYKDADNDNAEKRYVTPSKGL